jgi:hypothetical protein
MRARMRTVEQRARFRLREEYSRYLEESSGLHEFRREQYGDQWGQVWAREQAIVAMHRQMCTDLAFIISGKEPVATVAEMMEPIGPEPMPANWDALPIADTTSPSHAVVTTGYISESMWRAEWDRTWETARQQGWTVNLVDQSDPDAGPMEWIRPGATLTMGRGKSAVQIDVENLIQRLQSVGVLKGWLA